MSDLVLFTSNEVGVNCISSLVVAEMFDREHHNLLKSIDSLLSNGEETLNFNVSSYKTEQNKTQPMYLLTEVGFAILLTSLNLQTEEGKALKRETLSKFRSRQADLLKELKQLRAERKPKMLGEMEKGEHGTKYRPRVANEDKKILILPSVLEEISAEEAGYYNANDFTAEELLICMIALDESRKIGIDVATSKKRHLLNSIQMWRRDGAVSTIPTTDFYPIKSEYNDIINAKLAEMSID